MKTNIHAMGLFPLGFLRLVTFLLFIIPINYLLAQPGSDYAFVQMEDQLYHRMLVSNQEFDYQVYSLPKFENADVSQWQFKPTTDGYYTIFDRKHQAFLAWENGSSGRVFHATEGLDKKNAKWKLESAGEGNLFWIVDPVHEKVLLAGDTKDGKVYHGKRGNKRNAIWRLSIYGGTGKAPREMIVSETYIDIKYFKDQANLSGKPDRIILRDSAVNETGIDQVRTLKSEQSMTVTESWTFSEKVSSTIRNSVKSSVNAGIQIKIVNLGASVTHTNTRERSEENSQSRFKEEKIQYTFSLESKTTIQSGKATACREVFTFQKADLPFEVTVLRIYGDERQERKTIKGIWRGNKYNASVSKCKSYPLN